MSYAQNPAEMYEAYFVPAMFAHWTKVTLAYAAPCVGERVLDVACGTGIVARSIAPLVGPSGQVTGVDFNPAMLAVARAKQAEGIPAITWQEGNAQALPFTDASFDLLVCQHGLPFVPDQARAVREMRRVLAPSGRVAVMVLQPLERHPVFAALGASVARQLHLPVEAVMTPFCLSDANQLQALFMAAGFQEITLHDVSITAEFPEPERFTPLTVISSAAAVPAFAQLAAPERRSLLATVEQEIMPVVAAHRAGDTIILPVFAHLIIAQV